MKLGNRLAAISDLVERGSSIADIGTDHGYLSADLYEKKKCTLVFASDLNAGPLEAAKSTLKDLGYEEGVTLRLGPGLAPYAFGEIDSAVIAGMGGILISAILEDHIELARSLKYLILQPMQAPEALRAYLLSHDFEIVTERIAREGNKFYEIIKCKAGKSQISDPIKDEIGYAFEKNEEHKAFLIYRLRRHEMIIDSLEKQKNSIYDAEILDHKRYVLAIQEALHDY